MPGREPPRTRGEGYNEKRIPGRQGYTPNWNVGATSEELEFNKGRIARLFEKTLLRKYMENTGQRLSPAQKAQVLDRIDRAAFNRAQGQETSQDRSLLRATDYPRVAKLALENDRNVGEVLASRRGMEPMARVAEWDDEAQAQWSPYRRDPERGMIPNAEVRREEIPYRDRRTLDRQAASRVDRRIPDLQARYQAALDNVVEVRRALEESGVTPEKVGDEPSFKMAQRRLQEADANFARESTYLRLAPEKRSYTPRPAPVEIIPDPDITAQYPTWDQENVGTAADYELRGAEREINAVHDPSAESNRVDQGMIQEKKARRPEYTAQWKAARDETYRSSPRISETIRRTYGRDYDSLSPSQKARVWNDPNINQLIEQSYKVGDERSKARWEALGDFRGESGDYNSRGSIPGPQEFEQSAGAYSSQADDTIRRETLRPLENMGGRMRNMAAAMRAALESGDLDGALATLNRFDNDIAPYIDDVPGTLEDANMAGDLQADAEFTRTINPELQAPFRDHSSSGQSLSRNYEPLNPDLDPLSAFLDSLDPQAGVQGSDIDKTISGIPRPRYLQGWDRVSDELVPAVDDAWDIDNELSRPAFDNPDPRSPLPTFGQRPNDMPLLTPDQPTPVDLPISQSPAWEGSTNILDLPAEPGNAPPPPIEYTPNRGSPGYQPSPDPAPQSPDFAGTRRQNPNFSGILENLIRGRSASGDSTLPPPSVFKTMLDRARGMGGSMGGAALNILPTLAQSYSAGTFANTMSTINSQGGLDIPDSQGNMNKMQIDPFMSFLGIMTGAFDPRRFAEDPQYRRDIVGPESIPEIA